MDGGGAEKREKKASTSAAAKRGDGAVKEKKKASAASRASVKDVSAATPESSPRVAPPQASATSRGVDEDYDEGVDALLGLAASATSLSPRNAVTTNANAVAPPTALASSAPAPAVETENPRKRSLTSPILTESKRNKSVVPSPPPRASVDLEQIATTVKLEPLVEMTNGTKETNGEADKGRSEIEERGEKEEGETMQTNGSVAISA